MLHDVDCALSVCKCAQAARITMRMAANRPSSVRRPAEVGTDAPVVRDLPRHRQPDAAEACSMVGLDWVVIDMEAAPMTNVDTLTCCRRVVGVASPTGA